PRALAFFMEQHPERVHSAAVLDRPAASPTDPARAVALDALDRAEVSLRPNGAAQRADLSQMERLETRAKFAGFALTFDDVLLLPGRSDVPPASGETST